MTYPIGTYNRTTPLQVTPLLTTAPYVDGTIVGGLLSFSSRNYGGVIRQIKVIDKSKSKATLDFYLFSGKPQSPNLLNTDTLALVGDDGKYEIVRHPITLTDYYDESGYSIANFQDLDYSWQEDTGLFGLLVLNGSTPTYAVGDLCIQLLTWVD